ncbi:MAG: Chemotaxis protein methyltransferase CheR [Labilithrix sp.]|jgi:CheY-like chemotaxis protein|nr:Chemotaxis protein methyltransferase CheR [Labilithrix sp.]
MTSRTELSLRVLVVDDNEDACELLTVVLETRGHAVTVARDGERAVALLREQSFDVAIIDIGLPLVDGLDVARRARALGEGRSPFLVALTGYASASDRERSRRAGFDIHLAKPVDIDALVDVIARRREPLRTLHPR